MSNDQNIYCRVYIKQLKKKNIYKLPGCTLVGLFWTRKEGMFLVAPKMLFFFLIQAGDPDN